MSTPTFPWDVEPSDLLRHEAGGWSVDASTLGFAVGQWPKELLLVHVEGGPYLVPFNTFIRDTEGEILEALYRSHGDNPITIHVYND